MKAWGARDEKSEEYECTCVYAETRGKAHALALRTDCCEGAEWNDVRVWRMPEMDKYYRGCSEADWYNSADRIALVSECGWSCNPEYLERDDCMICPANLWCGNYQDWKEEANNNFSQYMNPPEGSGSV